MWGNLFLWERVVTCTVALRLRYLFFVFTAVWTQAVVVYICDKFVFYLQVGAVGRPMLRFFCRAQRFSAQHGSDTQGRTKSAVILCVELIAVWNGPVVVHICDKFFFCKGFIDKSEFLFLSCHRRVTRSVKHHCGGQTDALNVFFCSAGQSHFRDKKITNKSNSSGHRSSIMRTTETARKQQHKHLLFIILGIPEVVPWCETSCMFEMFLLLAVRCFFFQQLWGN